MNDDSVLTCFGFYTATDVCKKQCNMTVRCKAIVYSDGLNIASSLLEELLARLPDGLYKNVKFVQPQLDILLRGAP